MIKTTILSIIRKFGYDIIRCHNGKPPDFEQLHNEIIDKVQTYTMTSHERIYALIESVQYILRNDIKGDFVECGVYKGGSMMTIALTLIREGVVDKDLYLFDTFEGMPKPDERDIDIYGRSALEEFNRRSITDAKSKWVNVSVESVKKVMALTGYPMEKIHFVKGLVENTVPDKAPQAIALLRLDTDWYKSTIHELTHLYPLLSPKGVLIVDDYGYFKGAREAVDEYFYKNNMAPFLHRIDYTGRLVIKDG